MPKYVGYAVWAFAAGASIPVMAILNARLARVLGGPAPATVMLMLIGLITAVIVSLVLGASLPGMTGLAGAPPFLLLGGVIVAAYIFSVTVLAPNFGVANTILFVVCAQITVAAAIDDRGLFDVPVRPLTGSRIVGLIVVLAGITLAQLGTTPARQTP